MNAIFVLIVGIPLAAAFATATSFPLMLAAGALFLWALWAAPARRQIR